MTLRLLSLLAILATAGCTTDDKNLGRGPLGKADAIGSCVADDGTELCGGASDGNCWCDDQCESFGDCCPDKLMVCENEYDSCAGLTCGDECTLCNPADPDCFETAVIKMCQPDGSCASAVPECGASLDACDGKLCGDLCSLCDPGDPDCVETAEIKLCQADGSCAGTVPSCDTGDFNPCDGLTCGEPCTLCEPGDPTCVETSVPKLCQNDGSCAATTPSCS